MFRGESLPLDWVHPPRYWPPSVAKEHSAITTESSGLDQNIKNVDKEKQACLGGGGGSTRLQPQVAGSGSASHGLPQPRTDSFFFLFFAGSLELISGRSAR